MTSPRTPSAGAFVAPREAEKAARGVRRPEDVTGALAHASRTHGAHSSDPNGTWSRSATAVKGSVKGDEIPTTVRRCIRAIANRQSELHDATRPSAESNQCQTLRA